MANESKLNSLRDIIKQYRFNTKKKLGQHFIFDQNLTDRIVRVACNDSRDLSAYTVIELGPGPGGLTRSILALIPKHLYVIELDLQCLDILKELKVTYVNQLTIIADNAFFLNKELIDKLSNKRTIH